MWHHLLGMDWVERSVWTAERARLLASAKPHLERWTKRYLCYDHEVRPFIYLLETDAAISLRIDGLVWLDSCARSDAKWNWYRSETWDAVAGFLRLIFEKHWSDVRSSPVIQKAFMALATKLASLQNPLAMEMLQRTTSRI